MSIIKAFLKKVYLPADDEMFRSLLQFKVLSPDLICIGIVFCLRI